MLNLGEINVNSQADLITDSIYNGWTLFSFMFPLSSVFPALQTTYPPFSKLFIITISL